MLTQNLRLANSGTESANPPLLGSTQLAPTDCAGAQEAYAPGYLALDFDGVLHSHLSGPSRLHCSDLGSGVLTSEEFVRTIDARNACRGRDALFARAGMLSKALAGVRRDVRIVIATSWRNAIDIDTVKAVMPRCLARRVAGTLARSLEVDEEGRIVAGIRGRLMQAWINGNDPGAQWFALDDVDNLYADHTSHLVLSPWTGVEDETLSELVRALHSR